MFGRSYQRTGDQVASALESRELGFIGGALFTLGPGAWFSNMAVEQIYGFLGWGSSPTSTTQYAASVGIRVGAAAALALFGLKAGGTVGAVLAGASLGALALASADFYSMLDRVGVPFLSSGKVGNSRAKSRSVRRSRSGPRRLGSSSGSQTGSSSRTSTSRSSSGGTTAATANY